METKHQYKNSLSVVMIVIGIIFAIGGICCAVLAALNLLEPLGSTAGATFPSADSNNTAADPDPARYSVLTGLELADDADATAPIYCVQTPNGLDGARPQAGLAEAGVVFEAIAEAGITRFAALYQEPTSGAIGPIRSLRTYYLQWDTPFNCTVVHAGGSGDALAALYAGKYSEIDEEDGYTYRGSAWARSWNNLFTTPDLLAQATAGRSSAGAVGFARLTPDESAQNRVEASAIEPLVITEPSDGDTSFLETPFPPITLNFGSWAGYNVVYTYDNTTNTYLRSYDTGEAHLVYQCPPDNAKLSDPEAFCSLVQLAPSVVVAMIVDESRASDNYHEDITAIGQGDAYIFQNGTVIEGTWSKDSTADQIKFFDADGAAVKLAVGQTFVEAIPTYGSVRY